MRRSVARDERKVEMPVHALYIQKETAYFGEPRTFGNTYHYFSDAGAGVDWASAAASVADLERTVAGTFVDFVSWQVWGPTDGPEIDNVIVDSGELTGSGSVPFSESLYKEACLLVVWPLERSAATNRRRWLRKFLRSSAPDPVSSGGVFTGASAMSQAERDQVATDYAVPVTTLAEGPLTLCTADGDQPTQGAIVRPYLYTRQIGQ